MLPGCVLYKNDNLSLRIKFKTGSHHCAVIRIEYFLIANLNHNFKSIHTCICGKMLMIIELPGLVDKALCFILLDFSLNVA